VRAGAGGATDGDVGVVAYRKCVSKERRSQSGKFKEEREERRGEGEVPLRARQSSPMIPVKFWMSMWSTL
jgi:hypothetical protein